jgi:hypothetical protein
VKFGLIVLTFLMLAKQGVGQYLAFNEVKPVSTHVPFRSYSESSTLAVTSVNLPGERMMKAGRTLTIAGGALLVAGIVLVATADEQYYNSYTTSYGGTYEEGDPQFALGLVMAIGGVGMTIPGIILWSKGSKRYKAYQQRESALEINPSNLGLRYRF